MTIASIRQSALIATLAGTLVGGSGAFAQAWDEEVFVVVKAGRIITVSGEDIENGEIVIVDGEIRLVGKNLEYPSTATVIDASSETVMPGLVHPRTNVGVPGQSRGGVNGDHRAIDDFYLTDVDHEDLLRAGFTTVAIYPPGATIPGLATIMRTGGPMDARVVEPGSYLTISMTNLARDKNTFRGALEQAKAEIEKVKKAREEWEKKQKEEAAKKAEEAKKQEQQPPKEGEKKPEEAKPEEFKPPAINPKVKPLVDLIEKKAKYPPLIEVSNSSAVLHTYDVLSAYEDLAHRFVLMGGFRGGDFNYIVDELEKRGEKLVIAEATIDSLPDTIIRYNLPAALSDRGIEVALLPTSDSSFILERYRGQVALLARAGLTRGEALKGMTLFPAKAIGQSASIGTIEKGKRADLVFLNGDPLDPTAGVERVMIAGEVVWEAEED